MKDARFLPALRKLLALAVALALMGGTGWAAWRWRSSGAAAAPFRTESASRGRLVATITASGTLVPEEVIDVGAQVAGRIVRFGPDLDDSSRTIDYRSRVEPDTVLAQIDDALYAADAKTARADLGVAQADVEHCKAVLTQAKAKLYQAERDWVRARQLGSTDAISGLDYDTIQNTYETAKAAVPAAEADLLKAQKTVDRCQANLGRAETNLAYCTIRSPVKGVVIDRRVNVGQTVVSSLNAPSLFLIAKDLKRMQVWASVNEADIGSIHPGQPVSFTVDAYPHDTFAGSVGQIRYNATMNQNVVTYTVVVIVANDDLKLLPYQTANLQFKVDERADALLVPNAALRWRPRPDQVAEEYRATFEQGVRRREAAAEHPDPSPAARQAQATVWVAEGGFVRPVRLRLGLTDGVNTEAAEVLEGELPPGTPLVVGQAQSSAGGGTVNPFAPKVFGDGKKQ